MLLKECCKSPYLFDIKTESVLKFEPVTLNTLNIIYPFFKLQEFRTCDFTIGGLYMWIDYFNYEYCIYKNTLFIKGHQEDDLRKVAFAFPIGELPLMDALCLLKQYCSHENIKLTLSAVPEEGMMQIKELAVDCNISKLEDWSDYIYDSKSLATLVGHKYNKKRNRVNKFEKTYPGYSYEKITPDNIKEIRSFFTDYIKNNEKTNPMSQYENKMVLSILDNYFVFGFSGGVIRVNGEIIAFTVGEVIGDTLYVHIEKALYNYVGAYEIINMKFADDILHDKENILFINREEDVGDPGLRKAKMAYHPVKLLDKYNIEL